MMKEGSCCGSGACGSSGCCGCHYIAPAVLAVSMLLLLLVQLGVGMGGFGDIVMSWWPAGVLVYALSGFCPCKSKK